MKKHIAHIHADAPMAEIIAHLAQRKGESVRSFCSRAVMMYALGLLRRDQDTKSIDLWEKYKSEYLMHAGIEAYDATVEG